LIISIINEKRMSNIYNKNQRYLRIFAYGKNNFVEVSKNLVRYRSENNFIGLKYVIM